MVQMTLYFQHKFISIRETFPESFVKIRHVSVKLRHVSSFSYIFPIYDVIDKNDDVSRKNRITWFSWSDRPFKSERTTLGVLARVVHNVTFSFVLLGNVPTVDHPWRKYPDFVSGFLGVIFIAADHLSFCMDFWKEIYRKMAENRKKSICIC